MKRGDTLGAIAHRYGVTLAALASANGIKNYNFIYSGQVLRIPVAGGGQPPPAPTAAPQNPPPTAPPPSAQPSGTYVVQWGDTLGGIAYRFGVTIAALTSANGISNYNQIFVGQVLHIAGGASTAQTYTVQRGDTLAKIAARFGVSVAALQAANNLSNINLIFVGQVLKIP